MSVAVASMPHAVQEYPLQATAQPDLLEALLASCQGPPNVAKQMPGFGRELQPYFASKGLDVPLNAKTDSRNKKASPRRAARKQLTPAAVTEAKKATQKAAAQGKLTAAEAARARAVQMAALMTSWAGPGFCVAPPPDKLPTPASWLLT